MRMGDWKRDGAARKPARKLVRANGAAPVRVREGAEPAEFKPTRQDLKNVQSHLAREIERLQKRHAEITLLLR